MKNRYKNKNVFFLPNINISAFIYISFNYFLVCKMYEVILFRLMIKSYVDAVGVSAKSAVSVEL